MKHPAERIHVGENDDLIRRFTSIRASVLGYLRVLVRDPHLAEDVFQETSIVLLRRIDSFDRTKDFEAWVRGIARNVARNVLKGSRRLRLMPSPELVEAFERSYAGAAPGEAEQLARRLDHLSDCVERITTRQKKLLDLRYRTATSLREIAKTTGRTVGAVQVALSRVRQSLRDCVERLEGLASHGA